MVAASPSFCDIIFCIIIEDTGFIINIVKIMRSIFYTLSAAAAVAVFCFLNSGAPIQSGSNFLQEIDPIDQVFIRYLAKEGKSYATKEEYERRKEYFAA